MTQEEAHLETRVEYLPESNISVVSIAQPSSVNNGNAKYLEQVLKEVSAKSLGIIVDMSNLEDCSTALWAILVNYQQQLEPSRGKIVVAGMNAHIKEAFELFKLDHLFPHYNTVEEAKKELEHYLYNTYRDYHY